VTINGLEIIEAIAVKVIDLYELTEQTHSHDPQQAQEEAIIIRTKLENLIRLLRQK